MSSADDDGELMLRYAAGDMRAFALLYARHRGPLYRYLARQTRDAETASDLFQEVWSRVIAHRAHYQPRAPFRTFLFRIAHNCFIDHRRRAAQRLRAPEPLGPDGESAQDLLPAPAADAPDARVEENELQRRYRAALASLPGAQRDAFLLYEESGLSLAEVAAITGVGVETAKSRVRYALGKLRVALAPLLRPEPDRAATAASSLAAEGPLLAQESEPS
ncbi:MAG TPA: RNA polymerase sigma factor [Steroidobacteraceae bacterium]|nr:RNA polymerase sigma factor [Steroidobacteraceae bacterium]